MDFSNRTWPAWVPHLDTSRMPYVQVAEIQTGGAAVHRWIAQHVCVAAGSLHVLLAPLLLVWVAFRERPLASRCCESYPYNLRINARIGAAL